MSHDTHCGNKVPIHRKATCSHKCWKAFMAYVDGEQVLLQGDLGGEHQRHPNFYERQKQDAKRGRM